MPRADADAPRRVEDVERAHQVRVVGQRLAHAHEDEIVDARLRRALGLDDLRDDLAGGEVALPALQTAGAEFAPVGAADLGGEAEGEAVGALAEEIERGGDEDALDVVAGAEFPEEFSRCVGGALDARELERGEIVVCSRAGAAGRGDCSSPRPRRRAFGRSIRRAACGGCGTIAEVPFLGLLVEQKGAERFHRRDLVRIAL